MCGICAPRDYCSRLVVKMVVLGYYYWCLGNSSKEGLSTLLGLAITIAITIANAIAIAFTMTIRLDPHLDLNRS